jgi:hypothetical protein
MGPATEKTTAAAAPGKATTQTALEVEIIKQYPGPQQVQRAVKVNVPGKHFPQLQPAEQKVDYEGVATEFSEKHKFAQHAKAWGIQICMSSTSDAMSHEYNLPLRVWPIINVADFNLIQFNWILRVDPGCPYFY